MVAAVRKGVSMRKVARKFGVSLLTVQRWVKRAAGKRLDRADFSNGLPGPRRAVNRTAPALEQRVLSLRSALREHSDLGEFGPDTILRALAAEGCQALPGRATIHRILTRHGALDGRQRVRRPAPPRGWYLPEVAAARAELDEFDIIEGLVIRGGTQVEVLTAVSLHGGLVQAWPQGPLRVAPVRQALSAHWREVGVPGYAQFDNDTRFQGPHQHADALGSVIRLCLALGVVPVFAPPHESGFQAAIESFNGRWQAKVWARFHHPSLQALRVRSQRYVTAHRAKAAVRAERAPLRRPYPEQTPLNLGSPPRGRVIFIRRTSDQGRVYVLGRRFAVDRHWPHRLVRCEVNLDAHLIRFHGLRRREPTQQPLLNETPYALPKRRYRG